MGHHPLPACRGRKQILPQVAIPYQLSTIGHSGRTAEKTRSTQVTYLKRTVSLAWCMHDLKTFDLPAGGIRRQHRDRGSICPAANHGRALCRNAPTAKAIQHRKTSTSPWQRDSEKVRQRHGQRHRQRQRHEDTGEQRREWRLCQHGKQENTRGETDVYADKNSAPYVAGKDGPRRTRSKQGRKLYSPPSTPTRLD